MFPDALLAAAYDNLSHVLCGLLLIARLGDVITTRLATPTLALEANALMRRLGWWFAPLTVLLCVLPYYSQPWSLVALMTSLLVSASNAGKVWLVRAVGEREYLDFLHTAARRGRRSHALASVFASAAFVALAGLSVMLFYPEPQAEWGFWLGLGIVVYALAVAVHGTTFVVRLFREARLSSGAAGASQA